MLGQQKVQPQQIRGTGQVVQRRVALAQRYGMAVVVQDGQQFPVAPDARLIDGQRRIAPLCPQVPQRLCLGPVCRYFRSTGLAPGVLDLIQFAGGGIAKIAGHCLWSDSLAASDASKLM